MKCRRFIYADDILLCNTKNSLTADLHSLYLYSAVKSKHTEALETKK